MKGDDYQCPLQPDAYIERRLMRTMGFYRERIPRYSRQRYAMRCVLILCGLTASVVAYLEQYTWAVVVTAVSAALTSWAEFTDVARKLERYTRAVIELENLVTRWKGLSEVDRASTVSISRLVTKGEEIISNERVGWIATSSEERGLDEHADTRGRNGSGAAAGSSGATADGSGGSGTGGSRASKQSQVAPLS